MITFRDYILAQVHRNDVVGDFARDFELDMNTNHLVRHIKGINNYRDHLKRHYASESMCNALELVHMEWKLLRIRIRLDLASC